MAVTGYLTINNTTQETLKVSGIAWIDDDAKKGGISKGDTIKAGGSATATMSNDSVIPPKGIGVTVSLKATSSTDNIAVSLEIPAVGTHSLLKLSASGLDAKFSGRASNAYVADIVSA